MRGLLGKRRVVFTWKVAGEEGRLLRVHERRSNVSVNEGVVRNTRPHEVASV